MPCHFFINPSERLVRATVSGAVTREDLHELRKRLMADPAFAPDLSVLIDVSDATSEALAAADIQQLAHASTFARGARRAFVAPHPTMFGLARMIASYRDGNMGSEETAVFKHLADAEEWLRR